MRTIELVRRAKAAGVYPLGREADQLDVMETLIDRNMGFYDAVTSGIPLPSTLENIENLNYLQVMFSHESIFSDRRDFAFARKVLHNTPQYQETLKTSLFEFGIVRRRIRSDPTY